MEKSIKITHGNVTGSPVTTDDKPRGDGVGTQNTDINVIISMRIEIEKYLEEKYDCFKSILARESSRKDDYTNSEATSGDNVNIPYFGFPLGPGIIKDNKNGNKKGYVGKSNLFVGIPDKRAEELSKSIEKITTEEKQAFEVKVDENCKEPD